jgi:lipopolysaccharide export system protein LptC
VKKMSSHTDPSHNKPAARRAQQRSGWSGYVGFAALGGVIVLMGWFIWQAGFLAPPSPQAVKTDDVVEKPEQITSLNASISGRDKANRPFEITAKSGEQDKTIANLVHMQNVTSVFDRGNGEKLDVTSDTGQYDRKTKALELSGNVVFSEGIRFKAVMTKAAINTDDQSLASKSPVKVDMQGTLIEADSLTVTDNGTRILFKGGVKAKFTNKRNTTGDGG